MAIQKRFLDHFLKDIDNGWEKEPPVHLNLRRAFNDSDFEVRKEQFWPLSGTEWTRAYFSAAQSTLEWSKPQVAASLKFDALQQPITLLSPPLETGTEITGPLAAKIFASSSTSDIDLFVTLQAFSPDGREVDFQGTIDPHTPLAQGWLRASHRKLNVERSLSYRPFHSHDELQPLNPEQVYELDIEIWPTNVILPPEFRLGLQISGKDFERPPPENPNEAWVSRGSGPWLHTNVKDRPEAIFGGKTTVYSGGDTASYLLLPIIKT